MKKVKKAKKAKKSKKSKKKSNRRESSSPEPNIAYTSNGYLGVLERKHLPDSLASDAYNPIVATRSERVTENMDIGVVAKEKGCELWVVRVPNTVFDEDIDGLKLSLSSKGVLSSKPHLVSRSGKSLQVREAASGYLAGSFGLYGSSKDNQIVLRPLASEGVRVMDIAVAASAEPDASTVDLASAKPFVLPQRTDMKLRFLPTGARSVAFAEAAGGGKKRKRVEAPSASKKTKKKTGKKEKKAKKAKKRRKEL